MEQDSWRSIIVRGIAYAGEHAIRLALSAAVGIVVARYLGPEGLGLLSFAQSVFGLLIPVVLLGLPTILVREFSGGNDWRAPLASSLVAQIPIAVILAFIGFLTIALSRGFEIQALLTAAAMTPVPLLTLSQSLRSYLEATGRGRIILVSGVVGAIVASAVKITAVLAGAEVWIFAFAGTIELATTAIVLLFGMPVRPRIGALRRHARTAVALDLARESWPLLLSALAVTVYLRADLVMLALLVDDEETGIYAAAARLSEVWYFLPMASLAAVRPVLTRLHVQGAERDYEMTLQRFMSVSAGASYLAVVTILVGGPRLITLLYGVEYASAGVVLQLHVLATPFVFLGVAAGPWFIDRRMTRAALVRTASGATANVALNLILIPVWGARGAAFATLVSYAVAGVALNGLLPRGRRVFTLQRRALSLRWEVPPDPR